MTSRIFKSIFFSALIAVVLALVLIVISVYGSIEDRSVAELRTEAAYIARAIDNEGTARYMNGFKSENRVTVVGKDGTVLFDSTTDASKMENHAKRPEIADALKNGSGKSVRYSATLSENTIYYAMRMTSGNVLRLSKNESSVLGLMYSLLTAFIYITIIVVLTSLIAARLMSKRIVAPINEIDLKHPMENDTYAELSPLMLRMERQREKIDDQMRRMASARREFDTVTQNMSEGLVLTDADAKVLFINSSAARIFDADAEACIGSNILSINRSEELESVVARARNGKGANALLRLGEMYYELIASPVREEHKTRGVVIIVLDVTEKETAEMTRREFTANVSHELKTPLTSISGYAEIMMNGLAKEEDTEKFAGRIYDEANRLVRLVNDIIKLAQLDEKVNIGETEPFDLYTAADDVVARLDSVSKKAGIPITLSGEHCMVRGIRKLATEMIFNLCDNAVKYNRPGGSVDVKVDATGRITVSDTGIGIPKDDIPRVFERFYRVDKSHSKETGGTGLGLSIVKHGAAVQNADLNIDSSIGKGTSISIKFKR